TLCGTSTCSTQGSARGVAPTSAGHRRRTGAEVVGRRGARAAKRGSSDRNSHGSAWRPGGHTARRRGAGGVAEVGGPQTIAGLPHDGANTRNRWSTGRGGAGRGGRCARSSGRRAAASLPAPSGSAVTQSRQSTLNGGNTLVSWTAVVNIGS